MTIVEYENRSMTDPRPGGIILLNRHGYPATGREPVILARQRRMDYLTYNRLGLWLMFAFVMVALAGLFGLIP